MFASLQSFSQTFHAGVDIEAEQGQNCKWNYNYNNLCQNENIVTRFYSTCHNKPEPGAVEDNIVFILPHILDKHEGSRQKLELKFQFAIV